MPCLTFVLNKADGLSLLLSSLGEPHVRKYLHELLKVLTVSLTLWEDVSFVWRYTFIHAEIKPFERIQNFILYVTANKTLAKAH